MHINFILSAPSEWYANLLEVTTRRLITVPFTLTRTEAKWQGGGRVMIDFHYTIDSDHPGAFYQLGQITKEIETMVAVEIRMAAKA